jgi:hypothetical protein
MHFESAAPSIVKSIKQRDLLNTWLRLRRDRWGFPPIAEYLPARLEEERKELVYYIVLSEPDGWRFLIDSKGSTAAQAYGTSNKNNIGTDLREYLPADMRTLVLPLYFECATRQLPIYSVSKLEDVSARIVFHERLLLPFFSEGQISHVIASLKAISEDGKFEINNLLRNPDKLPEYHVRAVIDRDLSPYHAARETAERALAKALSSDCDVVEI